VIEAAPQPIRVIQDRPRARMPNRDFRGRKIVRVQGPRNQRDYFDDDDDDDSFVNTLDSYDSDDSFDPRQRPRSRTRRTKYYRH
jgi:hypothetical protein